MEPEEKHLAVLKKYFGHKEFRPMQWKIVQSIIKDKRDNCVIMATGYGKSICYQYPPVFCEGLAIVISPLISLMQDQVLSLKMKNIPACFMGSAQTKKSSVLEQLLRGEYRLMYVTPEWCTSEYGEGILHQLTVQYINITLIAIDEAHCVSQWGHDFRKSYRNLSKIRNILPHIPVIALTATATPQVREDIIASLKLKNPQQICTSFDRPNLFLSASLKSADYLGDLKYLINKQKIENNSCGSTIIYCPTKKIAEKLYCALRSAGLKCNMYHAGLSDSFRARAHDEFVKDVVEVMIATVAFGMGIDKPDVRLIIHYGAPKDIETYYQEIGRAGRDGLPSVCHTFYAQTDFTLNRGFLSSYSGAFKTHKEDMVRIMECYLQTADCRRRILLKHFSPNAKIELREPKECCDNCLKNGRNPSKDITYDLTEDALLLLKAVREMNERYGLMTYIFLLRGSSNKRLHERYHSSKLFGAGREKTEPWWKLLGGLLLRESLLEESISNFGQGWNKNNFPLKVVKLSEKGKLYLKTNGETTHFDPTPEMLKMIHKIPRKTTDGWIEMSKISEYEEKNDDSCCQRNAVLEDEIFEELLKFRSVFAGKLNCMPYMVLENRSIQDLCMKQPKTIEDLALVEGINEAKIKNFGKECLECIRKVIETHKSASHSINKVISTKRFMKNFAFKSQTQKLSYEDDAKSETERDTSEYFTCENEAAIEVRENHETHQEIISKDNLENSFADDDNIFNGDILATMDEIEMKAASDLLKPKSSGIPFDNERSTIGFKRQKLDEIYRPSTSSTHNTYLSNSTSLVDMVKINREKKKEMKKKIKF